jgi:purine-cytosine permease-like protein
MIFLLIVATVAAPIIAILFAEWWRVRRRAKSKEPGK